MACAKPRPTAWIASDALVSTPRGGVHGHERRSASPTTDRHINVCVEQLNYRPARLSDIRLLARRMIDDTEGAGPHYGGTHRDGQTPVGAERVDDAMTVVDTPGKTSASGLRRHCPNTRQRP